MSSEPSPPAEDQWFRAEGRKPVQKLLTYISRNPWPLAKPNGQMESHNIWRATGSPPLVYSNPFDSLWRCEVWYWSDIEKRIIPNPLYHGLLTDFYRERVPDLTLLTRPCSLLRTSEHFVSGFAMFLTSFIICCYYFAPHCLLWWIMSC